jgi:hypothetical protein
LFELDVPEARLALKSALNDPIGPSLRTAVEIAVSLEQEDWIQEVSQVLSRVNSLEKPFSLSVWVKCAEYLLGRNCCLDTIRDVLPRFEEHDLRHAAILALKFFPESALAVEVCRKALRSGCANDRMETAAALVAVNPPWCRAELKAVLNESDDDDDNYACRGILSAVRNSVEDAVLQDIIADVRDRMLPLRNQQVALPANSSAAICGHVAAIA